MSKISSTQIGILWEEAVIRFLEGEKTYKVIAKRFKCKGGEIDLIAIKNGTIIFIEVKYRKTFEDFEGIVTSAKFKRIFLTHEIFLEKRPEFKNCDVRFDIIFISKDLSFHHIENVSI